MPWAIGDMLHRLKLYRPVRPTNATTGEDEVQYQHAATVYGGLRPLTGRSLFAAQQAQKEGTHEGCIWFLTGFSAAWQVEYSGRRFALEECRNIGEADLRIEFTARERQVGDGRSGV